MSAYDQHVVALRISRIRIGCAVVAFVAALGLYTWTLAPTVTLVDSGELIVAARTLGVAHPPGFPLYVLLAHLATLVPFDSVAGRVNFASALFAALASSVVTLVVLEALITARISSPTNKARTKADRKVGKRSASLVRAPKDTAQEPLLIWVPCVASGLLLAFSRTLWGYATIAEVYTLNTLLILVIFFLMFRWRRGILEARRQDGSSTRAKDPRGADGQTVRNEGATGKGDGATARFPRDASLYAAAFVFGLALGVHHVSVGLMLPAFAVVVFATEGFKFFTSRRLVYAALFGFAGLFAIYAYLPLAASRNPIMNWGDPRTLERLWWHVTGRQYQVFFSFSLNTMANQFGDFIKLAAREFSPWWLPVGPALAIGGFAALFRRDRTTFWFLVFVMAADLAYSLGYEIAEDKDAYYLPAFLAMAIAAGFGAEWLITQAKSRRPTSKAAQAIAAAFILFVPAAALVGNLPYDNRGHYLIARDYVDNIFSTVEPGGMLLTRDWQVYSPMLYVREIEHGRDDAVVIDINQLRRSWYFDYLARAYPTTIEQSRDKIDAFLEDLRRWEHDPDLYQRDVSLNQRINSRFYDMILALVATHIRTAPVYVTLDIAADRDSADSELTKSLAGLYQLVPQGLVFQLSTERAFQQPSGAQLITRGLVDGALKFEADDVVKVKVLPVYATMYYNRGRYLASASRHDQAIEAFKKALDLEPGFSLAQQAINESLKAIRKTGGSESR
jgi:tetratricopeptide (TPR) repeat protein